MPEILRHFIVSSLRRLNGHIGPIHMSSQRPTSVDYLRELGRLIQRNQVTTCVVAAQELQDEDDHAVSTKRPSDEGVFPPSTQLRY